MEDTPHTSFDLRLDCKTLLTTEQRLNAVRDWMQGFGDENIKAASRALLRKNINEQLELLGGQTLEAIDIKVFTTGKWEMSLTYSLEKELSEQKVTPWDVEAEGGINYDKLVKQFGSSHIDEALLKRFEKVTGAKPHPWLRRGYFFSHRFVEIKKVKNHKCFNFCFFFFFFDLEILM